MRKRIGLWALKLIGVLLFLWILSSIDAQQLIRELATADKLLLTLSFPLVFLIYFCRTNRWKELVHAAGITLPMQRHWEIMNVGIFLACILPGKIGEMGKAAYLGAAGMRMATALMITILDRVIDTVCVGLFAAAGVGILFGWQWSAYAIGCILLGAVIALPFRKWLRNLLKDIALGSYTAITLWTVCAWIMHFAWAITLARAVGIETGLPILVSVITFAGILSLLPIAPSGLGTRDAALVLLLAPYGIPPEQAVALAFLMFVSIILSGFLGGWYWLKGVR
ncbi:flippase-like domain-containing protein [Candidatus Peregrinibacteria bacterium]|nr:flippase-like domain-containing protein [Candidatus Peregrinibacteria bacterium]